MSAKTLVVSLDAADRRLFESHRATGHASGFGALADEYGVRAIAFDDYRTDDCVWASFQYALPPGEHGRYFWKRDPFGDGRFEFCDEGEEDLVAFWEPLADAELDVAIFDLPKNRLTSPGTGLHLVNWLVHGRYREDVVSWPPELATAVVNQFGAPPPSRCAQAQRELTPDVISDIEGALLESVRMKHVAARHYLDQRDWQVYMTCFKELHCASHLLWPTTPDADGEGVAIERFPDALLSLQAAVEIAIQDLVERSGAEHLAVFSTTGITANRTLDHLAPELVRRLNSRYAGSADETSPVAMLEPFNEDCVALRVHPDHVELVPEIGETLRGLRDSDSHRALFGEITFPKLQWRGARSWKLPDIIAKLDRRTHSPTRVHAEALGEIGGEPPPIRRGNHAGDGYGIFSPSLAGHLPPGRIAVHDIGAAIQSAFGVAGRT